jgi:hypothetical protein
MANSCLLRFVLRIPGGFLRRAAEIYPKKGFFEMSIKWRDLGGDFSPAPIISRWQKKNKKMARGDRMGNGLK